MLVLGSQVHTDKTHTKPLRFVVPNKFQLDKVRRSTDFECLVDRNNQMSTFNFLSLEKERTLNFTVRTGITQSTPTHRLTVHYITHPAIDTQTCASGWSWRHSTCRRKTWSDHLNSRVLTAWCVDDRANIVWTGTESIYVVRCQIIATIPVRRSVDTRHEIAWISGTSD